MSFNSSDFLIFFPIVVLIYFLIPQKLKNYWLLIASYYFYMCWNAKYALIILFSTIVTYLSGLALDTLQQRSADPLITRKKKIVIAISVLLNLSLLFYFKYINFAIGILGNALSVFHIQLNLPSVDILLPVGISFYTFQALGYTIDVYRGNTCAEKNFFQYALFVSFFPQLVAGPIERSSHLLQQLATPHKFNSDEAKSGLLLMLWGFFLKIVLADRIAIFVDWVYGDYHTFGGWYLIVATALFAIQIYCDFAGYSIIAMGAAQILGIRLMENFQSPYLAVSVADFWRRWHISLTSWFRDYLYIPLGGSRCSKWRKYMNKMIVFLVSGLWHGAKISFVVWGGLNGLYQIIGEILQPLRDKLVKLFRLNRNSIGHKAVHIIVTFVLIDFTWIFFRANSFSEALTILSQIIHVHNPWILFDGSLYNCGLNSKNFCFMLLCILLLFVTDYLKQKKICIREIVARQDAWCQVLIIAFSVVFILVFGIYGTSYDASKFIYFQF